MLSKVIQIGTLLSTARSDVWETESALPDGRVRLRAPKRLDALLLGPFFSRNEAEEFAKTKKGYERSVPPLDVR